jgi:uncharacterized Zn-binding protein involved in type VI secretion
MPNVSIDSDTAGGDIIASASTVKFNDLAVVLDGDSVDPHSPGGEHNSATVPAGINSTVKIEDKLVVVAGDVATCGHTATGSATVSIG